MRNLRKKGRYNMKIWHKIIISIMVALLVMTFFPLLAINCFPGWTGLRIWFLYFQFGVPIVTMILSILAGGQLRQQWWVCLVAPALFPIGFGMALGEFVWQLYIYSALSLPWGILIMLATYWIRTLANKNA